MKLTPELDGMTVTLPSATRNMFVDGTLLHLRPVLAQMLKRYDRGKTDQALRYFEWFIYTVSTIVSYSSFYLSLLETTGTGDV